MLRIKTLKSGESPLSLDIQPIKKCCHLSFLNTVRPATSQLPASSPIVPVLAWLRILPGGSHPVSALLLSPLYYSLKQLQAFENVTVLLLTLQGLRISHRKEPSPGTRAWLPASSLQVCLPCHHLVPLAPQGCLQVSAVSPSQARPPDPLRSFP